MLTKNEVSKIGNSVSYRLRNNPPEDPDIRDALRNQLALVETLHGVWQEQERQEQKSLPPEPVNENILKTSKSRAATYVTMVIMTFVVAAAVWYWLLPLIPSLVNQPIQPIEPSQPYVIQSF